jgi:hypothetical protein
MTAHAKTAATIQPVTLLDNNRLALVQREGRCVFGEADESGRPLAAPPETGRPLWCRSGSSSFMWFSSSAIPITLPILAAEIL